MEILLRRKYLKPNYTIGSIEIDGQYICESIEDQVRDFNQDGDLMDPGEGKIPKETAIPYGRYPVKLTMSPKFKRLLPLVLDVKHFTGIRIHKMGTKYRPGTAHNSWGCIGPGENKVQGGIVNSEKYEMIIVEKVFEAEKRGEEIWINIIKDES